MDKFIDETEVADDRPLVTIGIPTYNRVVGLERTIRSALSQSYQNVEIIVADNCTEDKVTIEELISKYSKNNNIRYYRHSENFGSTYNFEFILRNANGKFCIFFPDDDDYSDPNIIEAGVKAFLCNPLAVLAFGAVEYIDKTNTAFVRDDVPYKLNGSLFSRMINYITYDITDNLMYGMFRTSVVKDFSFERNVPTAEKFFILHLVAKGQVCDAPGMTYRNIYSFKTRAEAQACVGSAYTKSYTLTWYKKLFEFLPVHYAIFFCVLYTLVRVPKISWPVRKMFCLPKTAPGRVIYRAPKKEKLSNV